MPLYAVDELRTKTRNEMINKDLRTKAQDYIEENGICRNIYQVEKAFIDGAKMVLTTSSSDIHSVINRCEHCKSKRVTVRRWWRYITLGSFLLSLNLICTMFFPDWAVGSGCFLVGWFGKMWFDYYISD